MNGEQRIKQKNAGNNSFEAVLQLVEQRYWHQSIGLEEVGVWCSYSRPLPEEKQCSLVSFFPKQNHRENWNPTFRGASISSVPAYTDGDSTDNQNTTDSPRQCQAGGLSALGTATGMGTLSPVTLEPPSPLCFNPSNEVLQWMLNSNLQEYKDDWLEIEGVKGLGWKLIEGHSTTVIKCHPIQ